VSDAKIISANFLDQCNVLDIRAASRRKMKFKFRLDRDRVYVSTWSINFISIFYHFLSLSHKYNEMRNEYVFDSFSSLEFVISCNSDIIQTYSFQILDLLARDLSDVSFISHFLHNVSLKFHQQTLEILTSIHVLSWKIFINSSGDIPFEINSVAEFWRTGFLHNQRSVDKGLQRDAGTMQGVGESVMCVYTYTRM